MEFTAQALCDLLKGKLEGDAQVTVNTLAKIEEAKTGSLSFIANLKYLSFAYTTDASILLVNQDIVFTKPLKATLIRVPNAYESITTLLQLYEQEQQGTKSTIETPNFIHPTAKIGKNVYIAAFTYIGENASVGNGAQLYPHTYIGENVHIGNNSVLHAGVKVYHGCNIGNRCVIHANTVIGSDGFGFKQTTDASYVKVPQIGIVVIEDDVEIGSNVCVDRATMGATVIRQGVKLDNLIQVGHNVEIGANTVIAAQTGISGSTKLGRNCLVGGQVGFAGHIKIANNTQIGAQSGLPKSIKKEGQALYGSPAFDYKSTLKSQVLFKQLPQIVARIKKIEQQLNSNND